MSLSESSSQEGQSCTPLPGLDEVVDRPCYDCIVDLTPTHGPYTVSMSVILSQTDNHVTEANLQIPIMVETFSP